MFFPTQGIGSFTTSTVTGLRAALIDSNNVVQNVIVWSANEDTAPEGLTPIVIEDIHTPVDIGWLWQGDTNFTNPNPPEVHVALEPSTADLQSQIDILQQALAKLIEQSK